MKGRIIKGIAGFYYVYVPGKGLYECKAKGIFRKRGMKPLVGDEVTISLISEEEKTGNVDEILPRRNDLIRPAVANVDQALVVFAAASPTPDRNLLDRFLVMMEYQDLPSIIVFNKIDLADPEKLSDLVKTYEKAGYPVLTASVKEKRGLSEIRKVLEGKTTTLAGPSGVGKSSLINSLQSGIQMETGEISKKIARGKNTTRHAQIIPLHLSKDPSDREAFDPAFSAEASEGTSGEAAETYIVDTPGFSSVLIPEMKKESLDDCFPEFHDYIPRCRFAECAHIHEPDCAVKDAVEAGAIARSRYENYLLLYEEIKNRRSY
ncbi:MAG: ribosome small subunit-dependent GTPase A [Lachnospiraceae bacterium]|nr:ribosome small subunit-dependent GTPase A [Lachnospiraceae bacterium]